MPHPLVLQLRFTRSEFLRAIVGVSEEDAQRRLLPMNCISWCVGHLASQEQRYWFLLAQERLLLPEIHELYNYGAPAHTPPLGEIMQAWEEITGAADPWLDTLTSEELAAVRTVTYPGGQPFTRTYGSLLQRVIYHYWFHTGEVMAIRQQLDHTDLPEFVGNIDDEAPYTPESPV
jgi:uncharacterized damage-inducible protein DinB